MLCISANFQAVKKWRTIKSKTKSKEGVRQQELKQTGGGESAVPCDPSPLEQRVLGIIGQVSVRGIPGGVDSGATEAGNSEDVEGKYKAIVVSAPFVLEQASATTKSPTY